MATHIQASLSVTVDVIELRCKIRLVLTPSSPLLIDRTVEALGSRQVQQWNQSTSPFRDDPPVHC